MEIIKIRLAVSQLVRSRNVQNAAAVIIDVFHALPERGTERDLPAFVYEVGIEEIEMNRKPRFASAIVVINGYQFWRNDNWIRFEKIVKWDWEQRVVCHVEFYPENLQYKSFMREVISEPIPSGPSRLKGIVSGIKDLFGSKS